jgi:hypothetical protein
LDYRPDCWNIRLALTENVSKTTTSSGREKEYIDRTLYAYINLGGVEINEQTYKGNSGFTKPRYLQSLDELKKDIQPEQPNALEDLLEEVEERTKVEK